MAADTAATIVKVRAVVEGLPGLNQLKTAMRGMSAEAKHSAKDIEIAKQEISKLKGAVDSSVNSLRLQSQAWTAIRNSAKIGSDAYREATRNLKELNREMKKTQMQGRGGGLASLGAVASAGFFGGPEALVGAGVGAFFGPQGAFAGAAIGAQVAQLRKAAAGAAEYSQTISRLNIALQSVTKSSEEYARAQQAINSISEELNVPILEATQGFTRLTAAVVGAGGNVSDAETVFRGITSAIKATGGTAEDVQGALLAMSQVFSKGKVSAEELQGQLGERLPGAVTLFAQATNRTLPQLAKDLEQGTIGLNDLMLFTEELSNRYASSAAQMAKSTEDSGARMKVALDKLGKTFGDFFKPIKVNIDRTIEGLANMVNRFIQAAALMSSGLKVTQKEKEDIRGTARQIARLRYPDGGFVRAGEEERLYQQMILDKLKSKAYASGMLQVVEAAPSERTVFEEPKGTKDKPKGRKIPVQRLADLEARSELGFELSKKQLRVQELITAAKDKGNEYDAQMLPLIGNILQQSTKIAAAEQKVTDLTENKAELLKQGMSIREWNTRYDVAAETVETERINRQTAFQKLKQQEGEISKKINQDEVAARSLIQKVMVDSQMQSIFLTEEDRKRLEINRTLADVIDKVYGKLTNEELLEAIRELRKALQDAADAGKDFGTKVAKSFADVVKESGELAQNLGASLGNAFLGLGDQLADFVQTGKMQFADFARSVLNDLSRILIRFAMFQTLKALVPGGSALGKFLGFANGGIMTSNGAMPLKRYANGGIATSPQLAMFGEGSRPEAYVPLPDGRTIPVTMKGGGEMGNIVVNVDANGTNVQGDQPNANKLGEALGAAVRAELIRQKRPGGLLS